MFRAVHGVPDNQCLLSPVAAVSTGEIRQSNIDLQGAYASAIPAVVETRGARGPALVVEPARGAAQRLGCTSLREDERGAWCKATERLLPSGGCWRSLSALRALVLDSVHLP